MAEPSAPSPAPDADDSKQLCRLVCTTHDLGGQVVLNHEQPGKQEWKFGRDKQCDVWLGHSKRISKVHFVIWVVGTL